MARITDVKIEKIRKSIKTTKRKSFLREIGLSAEKKSYIYCHKSTIFIAETEGFSLVNGVEIAKIDTRRMLSSRWAIKAKKVPILVNSNSNLFKIVSNRSFFDQAIRSRLILEAGKAVNSYIEGKESRQISFWCRDIGEIYLDKSIEDFLETGESKVIMDRNPSSIDIALIKINKSSIRYKNYIFNSNCIKVTDEYLRLIKEGNLEVEKSVVELLQEIYLIFKR